MVSDGRPSLPCLSLAISEYDHVRELLNGQVRVVGADLQFQHYPIAEIFARFVRYREWDISEMSLAMYAALLSQGDDSLVGIPVFPSRLFRQSSIFVRRAGGITEPSQLAGKRIGFPDWLHTAGVYARAYMEDQCGVPLDSIAWVRAGLHGPAGPQQIGIDLPRGWEMRTEPRRTLDELLAEGAVDAVISSHTLHGATGPDAAFVRLIAPSMVAEAEYYRRSGIFPIMHLLAVKRDVHARHPWLAHNLLAGFEAAKHLCMARLRDTTISRYPFPWMAEQAELAAGIFGADFFPYGIEANRPTLSGFLAIAHRQGVTRRQLTVDELFADSIH